MLKLQYTEDGLFMEQIAISLETLIAQRVILAVRTGQSLHVQPGQASFLSPANSAALGRLEAMLRLDPKQQVSLTKVDAGFVEISLTGTWIAVSADAEVGTFVVTVSDQPQPGTALQRIEFLLYNLWESTQAVSYLA